MDKKSIIMYYSRHSFISKVRLYLVDIQNVTTENYHTKYA